MIDQRLGTSCGLSCILSGWLVGSGDSRIVVLATVAKAFRRVRVEGLFVARSTCESLVGKQSREGIRNMVTVMAASTCNRISL